MDPFTIAMIGSLAMGALKGAEDQKNYKDMQKVNAVKEKWSPWTGRPGELLQRPSPTGTMMQAGLTGAMVGQQLQGNKQPDLKFDTVASGYDYNDPYSLYKRGALYA